MAQLLIQLARKEEEEAHPERRQTTTATTKSDTDLNWVAERVRKSKPTKKEALLNLIGAMFQFRGGISDGDKQRMVSELHKARHIDVGKNGRIQYP